MIADALQVLFNWGRDARTPKLLGGGSVHSRLQDYVLLKAADGSTTQVDVPPPLRSPVLFTLGDVKQLVDHAEAPEVYVCSGGVNVFFDRADRREVASMPFIDSGRFEALRDLESGKSFTPRAAVKFLRLTFHGTGIDSVVKALGKVDFKRTSDGKNDIEHGRESLGKSVERSVQQVDEIPEEFEVEVAPFANGDLAKFRARARVAVFLDLENERVELQTLSDEATRIRDAAVSEVADRLQQEIQVEGCLVYQGLPGASHRSNDVGR